jgi:hypothetical protein
MYLTIYRNKTGGYKYIKDVQSVLILIGYRESPLQLGDRLPLRNREGSDRLTPVSTGVEKRSHQQRDLH